MKLIVQIPCLNEEETLPLTIRDIPRTIEGIETVEILVIDDGSADRTSAVARELGVTHIIRFANTQGLAKAFMVGLDVSLKLGADIIVNTDADNQYNGEDFAKLVKPVIEGKADMVVGDRIIDTVEHFSATKKILQKLGSWVVQQVSNTKIPDATSGFRAYSKEAALKINVISEFTYTLETIIQAGKKNIAIDHTPIRTNEPLRKPRLYSSIVIYIKRSIGTIFRIYTMYEPLKIFFCIGGVVFSAGSIVSLRFLYFYFTISGVGHIQSLILAAVLMILGFQIIVIGLVADLISGNRRLIEDSLYRIRKLELFFSKTKDKAE